MQPTIKKIPKNNLLLFGAIAALTVFSSFAPAQGTIPSPTWDVYFSPRGGATYAIRQALESARSTVLVQAYSFHSRLYSNPAWFSGCCRFRGEGATSISCGKRGKLSGCNK
jgi:hypothetical protein